MTSTPDRRILTPRSRTSAFQRSPAFADVNSFVLKVNLDDAPKTPSPATPQLEWSESPPATEDPPTPANNFEPDNLTLFPDSPLAARKTVLEQNVIPLYTPSQPDSDVPEQLLSQLHSETGRSKRLFQNELSRATLDASSQLPSLPSSGRPSNPAQPLIKVEEEEELSLKTSLQPFYISPSQTAYRNDPAGRVAAVAVGIKQEDRPVLSDDFAATATLADTVATTSATEPSPQHSEKKKPLSLSLVWSLTTKLSTILPFEAVERFDSKPLQCVATTKEGERCQRSVALTAHKSFSTELRTALSSLERSFDFGAFAEHMGPLIEGILCAQSHRKPARKCLEELCSYSWRPRDIATTKPHQAKAIADGIESIFRLWTAALVIPPTAAEETPVPIKEELVAVRSTPCSASAPSAPETELESTAFHYASPKATVTSNATKLHATDKNSTIALGGIATRTTSKPTLQSTHLNHKFEKFRYSKEKRNATPQELIRQTLLKPLTKADMRRSGFIYVFWHPGSLGYVKIGYATDVEERLKRWRGQCGFELEQHKSQESRPIARVRHLHRVESLIHAELKDYRVFEPRCRGCGISHKEWFEVDPNYALKVVEKWTSRSLYSGGVLDPSIMEEIDNLCELTKAETYPPRQHPKKHPKKPTRKHSGRHRNSK
ncbi:uncharacterized protein PV07_11919 [Cladophialophora immunda]|uniref:Bacteriophage T5 Orf172 DNA-binding domain-containing protein n=1 Tax=Cladophialophora immunda TaxID=569365 RepID=A0A0D1Z7W1_9EURO|nr:uncharacterized protein PV07_11919 [Cladophialophora immunda]KIW23741.1 hypothetical protein PV07_11919 [Cladophialophora immunda]OQV07992.1 hypothetical protein CLAIMM_12335 [Cladophialophora immunda]